MRRAKQSEFNASEKRIIRLLWREALRSERSENTYECHAVGFGVRVLRGITGAKKINFRNSIVDGERSFAQRLVEYKTDRSWHREHYFLLEKEVLTIIRGIEAGEILVTPVGNDTAWGFYGVFAFVTSGRPDGQTWSDGWEFAFCSDSGNWGFTEWVSRYRGETLFDMNLHGCAAMPTLAEYRPATTEAWSAWGIPLAWSAWALHDGPMPDGTIRSVIERPCPTE
jgi:hypothetical protein